MLKQSGAGQPASVPERAVVTRFVKVAVSDTDFLKRFAAIKQLRQMCKDQPPDVDSIAPMLSLDRGGFDDAADPDIIRILAAGGPKMEQAVLKEFKESDGWAAVLALMEQPGPEVTRALAEAADDQTESAAKRRLCRLILAARGEKGRDWMARVVADVRAEPGEDPKEEHAYESFLGDLGYAACKFVRAAALPEALFHRVRGYNPKPTEGAALDALIALAVCGADLGPVINSEQFEQWLAEQPGDGKPGGFWAHLTRACLGIDTKNEMEKALGQLGTYGIDSDKAPACFVFLAPWLAGKDVRAAIRLGLSSSDAGVRRGALTMLVALGPDANEMLPELQKSLSDGKFDADAECRDLAREMFKYVAGLDTSGQWKAETDPQYNKTVETDPTKQ